MSADNPTLTSVIQAVADAVKQQHEELCRELKMVQSVSEREVLAAGGALGKIFEEMSDHTARLTALKEGESTGNDTGSFTAVLSRFSGEMPRLMTALTGEATTQSRLAASAAFQIRDVTNLTDEMSRISLWSKLVATNARVEAAHAGDAGRGFAVLAEALATMSNDIARATKAIQDRAHAVKGMVGEMANGAAKVADEGRSRSVTMETAVTDCQKAYKTGVLGSIAGFEQNAAAIRDRSNAALSHLQFQDRLQQALDHVMAGNARVVVGLETLANDVADAGTPESLAQLGETLREIFAGGSSFAAVQDLAGGELSQGDVQFFD